MIIFVNFFVKIKKIHKNMYFQTPCEMEVWPGSSAGLLEQRPSAIIETSNLRSDSLVRMGLLMNNWAEISLASYRPGPVYSVCALGDVLEHRLHCERAGVP